MVRSLTPTVAAMLFCVVSPAMYRRRAESNLETPALKRDGLGVFVFWSDIGLILCLKTTKVTLPFGTGKTSFYDKAQAFYDSAKIDLS